LIHSKFPNSFNYQKFLEEIEEALPKIIVKEKKNEKKDNSFEKPVWKPFDPKIVQNPTSFTNMILNKNNKK
jgi:hypothetical protein